MHRGLLFPKPMPSCFLKQVRRRKVIRHASATGPMDYRCAVGCMHAPPSGLRLAGGRRGTPARRSASIRPNRRQGERGRPKHGSRPRGAALQHRGLWMDSKGNGQPGSVRRGSRKHTGHHILRAGRQQRPQVSIHGTILVKHNTRALARNDHRSQPARHRRALSVCLASCQLHVRPVREGQAFKPAGFRYQPDTHGRSCPFGPTLAARSGRIAASSFRLPYGLLDVGAGAAQPHCSGGIRRRHPPVRRASLP